MVMKCWFVFFFQAEDGIRDAQESRGLGDVYKRQLLYFRHTIMLIAVDRVLCIYATKTIITILHVGVHTIQPCPSPLTIILHLDTVTTNHSLLGWQCYNHYSSSSWCLFVLLPFSGFE
eukprot:TRINITY_DN34291_c0_g1_i1.p2 TRINITY_DN34291_c0_g1~~TRINITY_DN34291_c0_g1_i1.p2  ORF type:complete len:118 (-),score=32.84 TRINITY_DN34291_c0_g1_i1:27-380(-)